MKELKLALTSGTQLVISEFSLPCHITMLCSSKEEMQTAWGFLTDAELSDAAILQDDEVVLKIRYGTVEGTQTVSNGDGTMTAHFYLACETCGGGSASLEDENADMREALRILGVTDETEVE